MLLRIAPIVLLLASNVFMTFAWYGHLRFKSVPLWMVVLAAWGIAFFEYCLQVPANRLGYIGGGFSAAQLKGLQEIITLTIFVAFSILYLKEEPNRYQFAGFGLIVVAAFLIFKK